MAKAIREFDGKELLHKYVEKLMCENVAKTNTCISVPFNSAPIDGSTDFDLLLKSYPWLQDEVCGGRGAGCFVYMASE